VHEVSETTGAILAGIEKALSIEVIARWTPVVEPATCCIGARGRAEQRK
jgi:hypothetical protein